MVAICICPSSCRKSTNAPDDLLTTYFSFQHMFCICLGKTVRPAISIASATGRGIGKGGGPGQRQAARHRGPERRQGVALARLEPQAAADLRVQPDPTGTVTAPPEQPPEGWTGCGAARDRRMIWVPRSGGPAWGTPHCLAAPGSVFRRVGQGLSLYHCLLVYPFVCARAGLFAGHTCNPRLVSAKAGKARSRMGDLRPSPGICSEIRRAGARFGRGPGTGGAPGRFSARADLPGNARGAGHCRMPVNGIWRVPQVGSWPDPARAGRGRLMGGS